MPYQGNSVSCPPHLRPFIQRAAFNTLGVTAPLVNLRRVFLLGRVGCQLLTPWRAAVNADPSPTMPSPVSKRVPVFVYFGPGHKV